MKNKYVAGLLALFGGTFGTHKFYLGKTGTGFIRFGLFIFGVTSQAGFIVGILGLLGVIDAIVLFAMHSKEFDEKYNRQSNLNKYRADRDRQQRRRDYREERNQRRDYRDFERTKKREYEVVRKKENPFKKSGIAKYKEYDFEGAIQDFKKALGINSKDVAVHFNLACAYSLTEQKENAFFHLNKAVEHGFVDFDKIQTHDAFAYLRVQDEFEPFVKNGYQLIAKPNQPKEVEEEEKIKELPEPKEDLLDTNLLDQIKKLGELREKGFLTEEEFLEQKKKLLR